MANKVLKIMNDWATSKEREKLNSFGGCGYYRTVKVAEQLSPEYEVTVWNREWKDTVAEFDNNNEKFFEHVASNYDIIWMHFTDNPIVFAWLRVACDKYGVKLVIDIDDNFLEVDKSNPALKKQNRGKLDTSNKVAMLATILSFADAITVSTFPLKNKIKDHIKKVHKIDVPIFVVPNYNDLNDWKFEPVKSKDVVIGYSGGLSHRDDLDMVLPSIKKVMEKYPHVGFQMMGQMNFAEAKKIFKTWGQDLRKRIVLMDATKTQPEYPKYMSEQPWTIGICPLIESPFNECKSHIKWMEYSMYKIPVIASKIYPYYKDIQGKETIQDGETGLLAYKDEWVDKLSLLIEDKNLREKLGGNAYKYISENWQYKDNKEHIIDVLNQISML